MSSFWEKRTIRGDALQEYSSKVEPQRQNRRPAEISEGSPKHVWNGRTTRQDNPTNRLVWLGFRTGRLSASWVICNRCMW